MNTDDSTLIKARGGVPHSTILGRIKVHPAGYGFVVPDDKSEDVHVSARARGASMDADTVEVEAWDGPRGREGRVLRVVERGRAKITGQIAGGGKHLHLLPDDPRVAGPVSLPGGTGGAHAGQAVVAEITRYPETAGGLMEARVLKLLGDPDDPRTEVEKVLACADVEEAFPADVVREAERVPRAVRDEDRRDRTDLRNLPFATIDPETARDFDDAVAIEPGPGGTTRLWVAVADVSHYVREGTALDAEARRRGCSIYLPDRAVPMLPEALSAHICSLVAEEDRLAMVARMDIDRDAKVVDADFCAAVIHSRARLDYPGVAAALAGDTRGPRKKYEPLLPALRTMDALARRMRQVRLARGALDLDLPEAKIDLDHDDPRLVRDVRMARKDPGERGAYAMIEEFMLAANEAVARSFHERGEDAVWRIHDAPDRARVEAFAELCAHYGIRVDVEEARTPRGLKRVLESLHGHPAEKPLAFQLLRSLKQATYDVVNIGHFGLASADYLHFTSPIRRYPDLVDHRLLKRRLAALGKPAGALPSGPPADAGALAKAAAEASFCEREAMEVEREVVDLYRAFFLRDRVGDVFEGTVTGVTGFGVFVQIEHPFVEGLVRLDALDPPRAAGPARGPRGGDFWELDEPTATLVGRRTGRSFALGDAVTVEVVGVSVPRRKIDFALAGHAERRRARSEAPHAGGPARGPRGSARPERPHGPAGRRHDRPGDDQRKARGPDEPERRRQADRKRRKDRHRERKNKGRPHGKHGRRK